MAITLLVSANTPNPNVIGDWNLQAAQLTACKQLLNCDSQILTEWETTTVPEIAKGTYIQHLGAIYIVDTANFPIAAGALAVGVNYIRLTTSGVTLTVDWAVSLAGYTWDYENNGLYNGASQILPYSITYAAAPTYAKHTIMNLSTNNAGDFILIDSNGESVSDITTTGAITGASINTNNFALQVYKVDIGVWDMDATATVNVDVSAIDVTKIISVIGYIHNDDQDYRFPLAIWQNDIELALNEAGELLSITRATSGFFDGVAYNSTLINRGEILVIYGE